MAELLPVVGTCKTRDSLNLAISSVRLSFCVVAIATAVGFDRIATIQNEIRRAHKDRSGGNEPSAKIELDRSPRYTNSICGRNFYYDAWSSGKRCRVHYEMDHAYIRLFRLSRNADRFEPVFHLPKPISKNRRAKFFAHIFWNDFGFEVSSVSYIVRPLTQSGLRLRGSFAS